MLLVPFTEVWTPGSGMTGSLFGDLLTGKPLFGIGSANTAGLVMLPWGERGEREEGGFRYSGKASKGVRLQHTRNVYNLK